MPSYIRFLISLLAVAYMQAPTIAYSQSWQRLPDDQTIRTLQTVPAVASIDIYEVVPTKIDTAIAWQLAKKAFAEISCQDADFLAGGHHKCEQGKKPILVRAVFTHGGTGMFTVRYKDAVLFVHHGSLGSAATPVNVPLIIDLPSVPASVFAWASGAM